MTLRHTCEWNHTVASYYRAEGRRAVFSPPSALAPHQESSIKTSANQRITQCLISCIWCWLIVWLCISAYPIVYELVITDFVTYTTNLFCIGWREDVAYLISFQWSMHGVSRNRPCPSAWQASTVPLGYLCRQLSSSTKITLLFSPWWPRQVCRSCSCWTGWVCPRWVAWWWSWGQSGSRCGEISPLSSRPPVLYTPACPGTTEIKHRDLTLVCSGSQIYIVFYFVLAFSLHHSQHHKTHVDARV